MEEQTFDIAGYINGRLQQMRPKAEEIASAKKYRLPRKEKKKMKKAYSSRFGVSVKQLRFLNIRIIK